MNRTIAAIKAEWNRCTLNQQILANMPEITPAQRATKQTMIEQMRNGTYGKTAPTHLVLLPSQGYIIAHFSNEMAKRDFLKQAPQYGVIKIQEDGHINLNINPCYNYKTIAEKLRNNGILKIF